MSGAAIAYLFKVGKNLQIKFKGGTFWGFFGSENPPFGILSDENPHFLPKIPKNKVSVLHLPQNH